MGMGIELRGALLRRGDVGGSGFLAKKASAKYGVKTILRRGDVKGDDRWGVLGV